MGEINEEHNEATLYWKEGGKALYLSTTSPALAERFARLGYILVGGNRFGAGNCENLYHFLAHTGCLQLLGAAVRQRKGALEENLKQISELSERPLPSLGGRKTGKAERP